MPIEFNNPISGIKKLDTENTSVSYQHEMSSSDTNVHEAGDYSQPYVSKYEVPEDDPYFAELGDGNNYQEVSSYNGEKGKQLGKAITGGGSNDGIVGTFKRGINKAKEFFGDHNTHTPNKSSGNEKADQLSKAIRGE